MAHAKMDAIEIQDAVMNEKWAHSPNFKLFHEGVVETAHSTGAGSYSHKRLSYFPNFMGTGSRDKHLRQSLCYLLLISIVTLKDLRVKCSGSISGNVQILNGTTGCCQIARVEAIAIAFACGRTFSPSPSNKPFHPFPHHPFHDNPFATPHLSTPI